jgi:hypothetical protein
MVGMSEHHYLPLEVGKHLDKDKVTLSISPSDYTNKDLITQL